jgi:hypothetical protein
LSYSIFFYPPQLTEVNAWLNQDYVRPGQHKQIKRIFAYKSELSLQQFLNVWYILFRHISSTFSFSPQQADRYNAALAELEAAEFACIGPPNKRHVWRLVESTLTEGSVLRSLLRLFRFVKSKSWSSLLLTKKNTNTIASTLSSEAITLLLTQWTGLHLYDLKRTAEEPKTPEEATTAAAGTMFGSPVAETTSGVITGSGGKRKAMEEEEEESPAGKRTRKDEAQGTGASSSSTAATTAGEAQKAPRLEHKGLNFFWNMNF